MSEFHGYVKARAADMLGYLYLERGELDRAREKFQTALLKRDDLDAETGQFAVAGQLDSPAHACDAGRGQQHTVFQRRDGHADTLRAGKERVPRSCAREVEAAAVVEVALAVALEPDDGKPLALGRWRRRRNRSGAVPITTWWYRHAQSTEGGW